MFLYIDPLKQGLKPQLNRKLEDREDVFIHRSIKTRIETISLCYKHIISLCVFIHRSIKTRIETKGLTKN